MMVFTFLGMYCNASLANDENLTLKDIYEGHSFPFAGGAFGATAWGTISGVQFNQDLSFTGKEYFGKSNGYALEYPVYYENSYCSIYGSNETPKTAPGIKRGSVYGIFHMSSMRKRYKKVKLYVVGGYFVKPHFIFISCKADVIDNETSAATFEDLLDNVITFKAPMTFKGSLGYLIDNLTTIQDLTSKDVFY